MPCCALPCYAMEARRAAPLPCPDPPAAPSVPAAAPWPRPGAPCARRTNCRPLMATRAFGRRRLRRAPSELLHGTLAGRMRAALSQPGGASGAEYTEYSDITRVVKRAHAERASAAAVAPPQLRGRSRLYVAYQRHKLCPGSHFASWPSGCGVVSPQFLARWPLKRSCAMFFFTKILIFAFCAALLPSSPSANKSILLCFHIRAFG